MLCVVKSTFIVSHITFLFSDSPFLKLKLFGAFLFAQETNVKCKYPYVAIEIYYTVMLRICNTCHLIHEWRMHACMIQFVCAYKFFVYTDTYAKCTMYRSALWAILLLRRLVEYTTMRCASFSFCILDVQMLPPHRYEFCAEIKCYIYRLV